MATMNTDTDPFDLPGRKGGPHTWKNPRRAPKWQQFADGQVWDLEQREDFTQTPLQAREAVKAWARRNGYRTRTAVTSPTSIRIQLIKKESSASD